MLAAAKQASLFSESKVSSEQLNVSVLEVVFTYNLYVPTQNQIRFPKMDTVVEPLFWLVIFRIYQSGMK